MTPSERCGIYPGVTREIVMRELMPSGYTLREGRYTREDLDTADEVFITNALIGVLPVTCIGSRAVGSGAPGSCTLSILESYAGMVGRETKKT